MLLQNTKKPYIFWDLRFPNCKQQMEYNDNYRITFKRNKKCPLHIKFLWKDTWRIIATSIISLCLGKKS